MVAFQAHVDGFLFHLCFSFRSLEQVDPEFKILNEAYPFVASRLLSDDSEELRVALGVLLTQKDGTLMPSRWSGLITSAAKMSGNDASLALKSFLEYILTDEATEIRYCPLCIALSPFPLSDQFLLA